MKQLDEKRLLEQKVLVEAWRKNKGVGTIVAPTGFGKSYIAVLIIQAINAKFPDRTTLIVTPTIVLKTQWEGHVTNYDLKNVTVQVINTAVKSTESYNLLVLDEIHRYAAETFINVFQIPHNYILGLTATFVRQDQKHYHIQQHCPVIQKMTLSHAKKNKYVSDFDIYCLGIQLQGAEIQEYDNLVSSFEFYFGHFYNNLKMVEQMLSNPEIAQEHAEVMKMPVGKLKGYAIKVFSLIQKRKLFLNSNNSKLFYAQKIINTYANRKVLTFSETKDFADKLASAIPGSKAIHTGLSPNDRKRMLEDFANNKFSILHAAKILDEGVDLPDVDMAIICSGSSSQRQSIQRLGRAIRFKPGKRALIVNLYVKDTQEETWLKARLNEAPDVHYVTNINEIFENQLVPI